MMRKVAFFKYLFVLLFIFSAAMPLGSFNIKKESAEVYHHFGVYDFPRADIPNTTTSFELWITKEKISTYENQKSYIPYKYKYRLIGQSKSMYYGEPRNTFIEGFKIFINNSQEPLNYYPLNFYVNKYGNILYEIKSNSERPSVYISWTRSYYDVRQ